MVRLRVIELDLRPPGELKRNTRTGGYCFKARGSPCKALRVPKPASLDLQIFRTYPSNRAPGIKPLC